jgi:xylulokinase
LGYRRQRVAADKPCILAIDLGTSGPKVALVTVEGEVLGCTSSPTRLELLPGGGAEQDPDDWWRAIVRATSQLHAMRLAPREAVIGVCCTAQWAGTVPVGPDGEHLRNAIIWMDTRGAPDVQALTAGLLSVEGYAAHKLARWIRRTGGAPSRAGKEPVAHILWLRRAEPRVYERTRCFLEPKDWLNFKLTGELAASTDSIALHWSTDNRNIDAIAYDDDLLALNTLPRDKLPPLRRAVDVLGTVRPQIADELGIPAEAKVVMGTPDVQSAAIGSGAVQDGKGHVYLGTSSWVTCHVAFKKTDLFRNMASLPSALPGRYLVANAQETAGACVAWLRDQVLFGRDELGEHAPPDDFFARFEALAGAAPAGSDKLIFTPWLIGERSPVADATLRGAFFNQQLSTTRGHLARAVLEGVAYNTRWLLGAVERFVGGPMASLRAIGGGASSALWCQILADVLDREIAQVENPVQCNARGAGLLGALGLGRIRVQDIPERVKVARRFEPRREHRRAYDELFSAYLDLYRATKGIFARLNA